MSSNDIDALMAQLDCDQIIECRKARRALVAMGHEAVPRLVEAIASKKPWVRWEALKALSQIGDTAALVPLMSALKDKEFDVRWLAAEGLMAMGRNAVVPLLKELIADPKSVWLREGAHHVFHDMNRGDLDGVLRPVIKALEDVEPSMEVLPAAEKALAAIAG